MVQKPTQLVRSNGVGEGGRKSYDGFEIVVRNRVPSTMNGDRGSVVCVLAKSGELGNWTLAFSLSLLLQY